MSKATRGSLAHRAHASIGLSEDSPHRTLACRKHGYLGIQQYLDYRSAGRKDHRACHETVSMTLHLEEMLSQGRDSLYPPGNKALRGLANIRIPSSNQGTKPSDAPTAKIGRTIFWMTDLESFFDFLLQTIAVQLQKVEHALVRPRGQFRRRKGQGAIKASAVSRNSRIALRSLDT